MFVKSFLHPLLIKVEKYKARVYAHWVILIILQAILVGFFLFVLCMFLLIPKKKKNAEKTVLNTFNRYFKEVEFTK